MSKGAFLITILLLLPLFFVIVGGEIGSLMIIGLIALALAIVGLLLKD